MTETKSGGLGLVGFAVTGFLLGFLVYRDVNMAVYIALFYVGINFSEALGLIPIIGVILNLVVLEYMKGWLLQFVTMSWVISIAYWWSLIMSVIATIIVCIYIISKL